MLPGCVSARRRRPEDAEGEILSQSDLRPTEADIDAVLPRFLGEIAQIPPMYSALKRDGKPLYEYARAGVELERTPRQVKILSLVRGPLDGQEFDLEVACSKGTYISHRSPRTSVRPWAAVRTSRRCVGPGSAPF